MMGTDQLGLSERGTVVAHVDQSIGLARRNHIDQLPGSRRVGVCERAS